MRKVYLDNLGLAYQRIHAAWRGLALVYGVKRAKPTIAEKASILEGFVEWLRTAMSAAEVSDRREYTVERSFKLTLSEHPAANGSYHVTFSPSRDSFNLFSSGEFSYAGSEAEPDALRVVGIEVALFSTGKAEHADFRAALAGLTDKPQLATAFSLASERRQRLLEQLTAEMVIVPPPSHTRVGDEALSHQPLPMRLDHVPFWAAGSTRPPLAPALDNGFVNASPLGTWRLRVSSEIHLRWIRGGTKSLDVLYGEAGLAAALADLGIYLKLRVAVRPSARTMAAAGQT
jgi:hypothetical protein